MGASKAMTCFVDLAIKGDFQNRLTMYAFEPARPSAAPATRSLFWGEERVGRP
jgi:hypothetical protein